MIFHFQKAALEDIPLIQQVGRATYEPYYPHVWRPGGLEWYMHKCFNAETLMEELKDPNYEFLIPRDESGNVVGFLKMLLSKPTPDGSVSNALYLEKIYLMPSYFRKGVGRELLQFVAEKAAGLGREAVWLIVMEHGPVKAYERAGYRKIGEMAWDYEYLNDDQRKGFVMINTLK